MSNMELKAEAYDILAQIQNIQNQATSLLQPLQKRLDEINQLIRKEIEKADQEKKSNEIKE